MRKNWWGYLFVSPWILLFLVFGLYPLLLSFYLTFFDYSFVQPENRAFVGMGNWVRAILDPLFLKSILNVVYNQAIFIILKNGLGLILAVLVYRAKWGGRFFRTVYFMPVLTSTMVLITIFIYLASPVGPVQEMLLEFDIISEPSFWTQTTNLPMPVIALFNTWKWFGISFVILLAGLYSIDPHLYEASSIDGARGFDQFRYITIPQLRPQLFFLLVIDIVNGMQMFTEVFILYGDLLGGLNNQGLTPVLYLYAQAFGRNNIGYASTVGLLLAVLIMIFTFIQFKFGSSEDR